MRILIIKVLVNLGVIKLDELSRNFRSKIIKRRKYKRRNLSVIRDDDTTEVSELIPDPIEDESDSPVTDRSHSVPHPGYPDTRAANKYYHHGCWVKMCGKDKIPMVLHFDTQRDAAEFIASETGLAVTRYAIYNAIRWSCGKLKRNDKLVAVISYDRP